MQIDEANEFRAGVASGAENTDFESHDFLLVREEEIARRGGDGCRDGWLLAGGPTKKQGFSGRTSSNSKTRSARRPLGYLKTGK